MVKKSAPEAQILVLILGGTINGDHRKTELIDQNTDQPKTNVKPYRDLQGRLPIQIYMEDVLRLNNVTFIEISDKDSKELTQADYQAATDEILVAASNGYSKVLYVMGTDMTVPAGRMLEYALLPHPAVPVIFVTAMEELTRDMDVEKGIFHESLKTDGVITINHALEAHLEPAVYIETKQDGFAEPMHVEKDFTAKEFKLTALGRKLKR